MIVGSDEVVRSSDQSDGRRRMSTRDTISRRMTEH